MAENNAIELQLASFRQPMRRSNNRSFTCCPAAIQCTGEVVAVFALQRPIAQIRFAQFRRQAGDRLPELRPRKFKPAAIKTHDVVRIDLEQS